MLYIHADWEQGYNYRLVDVGITIPPDSSTVIVALESYCEIRVISIVMGSDPLMSIIVPFAARQHNRTFLYHIKFT